VKAARVAKATSHALLLKLLLDLPRTWSNEEEELFLVVNVLVQPYALLKGMSIRRTRLLQKRSHVSSFVTDCSCTCSAGQESQAAVAQLPLGKNQSDSLRYRSLLSDTDQDEPLFSRAGERPHNETVRDGGDRPTQQPQRLVAGRSRDLPARAEGGSGRSERRVPATGGDRVERVPDDATQDAEGRRTALRLVSSFYSGFSQAASEEHKLCDSPNDGANSPHLSFSWIFTLQYTARHFDALSAEPST
jgi:hypothetical protein